MTPSRPCCSVAASSCCAVADDVVRHPPAPAVAELELGQARAALGVGQVHERVPVEPQQVEDDVGDRRLLGQAPDRAFRADVHPPLQRAEARLAVGAQGDDLPVEHRAVVAERAVEAPDLGIARRDVQQVARVHAQAARLGVADRAHAVPLDLEGPVLVVARQRAGARHHRHDLLGHGLGRRVGGRVHAVDHPVLGLVVLVDGKQRVAPLHALALQEHLELARLPLEHVVGPAVPDAHRARAVLALGDLALELQVLERMVLGVHRQAVVLGRLGQAVGDGEGDEHAVVLEAQVPVQARGVVLLDDETAAVAGRRLLPHGLGRLLRRALGPVRLELAAHESIRA